MREVFLDVKVFSCLFMSFPLFFSRELQCRPPIFTLLIATWSIYTYSVYSRQCGLELNPQSL